MKIERLFFSVSNIAFISVGFFLGGWGLFIIICEHTYSGNHKNFREDYFKSWTLKSQVKEYKGKIL